MPTRVKNAFKKCDFCDNFAEYKVIDDYGVTYMCEDCYEDYEEEHDTSWDNEF